MNWSHIIYPLAKHVQHLCVEKGVPTEVLAGQSFEYLIVVTNLSGESLKDVVAVDVPGPNMTLTGSSPQGERRGGAYAWPLGDMAPHQTETIRITATAPGEGSVGSCATATYNRVLCSTIPVVSPKLRLTKSGPAAATKCDPITYTMVVTNTGTGVVRDVTITDPLPEGLVGPNGERTLTYNAGSLDAGQSREFTATVNATRSGRYSNKAMAESSMGISTESEMVATVVTAPVLAISKDCEGTEYVGRDLDYSVTVRNTGDGPARDVVVTDTLPAGVSFVSASDGGSASGNSIVWNIGTLEPNAARTVNATVSPGAVGTYRNSVSARAYCADNVSDTCESVVSGIPAILLEVVDIEDPIEVGNNETYIITVTNQGSAPDTNVQIVAVLEEQQGHVSNSGETRGTVRGNTITFDPIPSLAPKAKATYRVVTSSLAPANIRFTVRLTSDQLDRPVQENESTNIYD